MNDSDAHYTVDVTNPATGELARSLPGAGPFEVDAALTAAHQAQQSWGALAPASRNAHLREAAHRLREHLDELTDLEVSETGKPRQFARDYIEASIDLFDHFAAAATGDYFERALTTGGAVVRRPFGVAALIVPWNFPLLIAYRFLPGLLAAGNCVVWKPSELTPLSAVRTAELLGLPEGVVTVLVGDARAGRPLVSDPRTAVVALTGSTATGREVGRVCGEQLKPALLELGGKDAVIVCDDVDPVWAAAMVADGCFLNTGQICTSMERVYVDRAIAEPFITELVRLAKSYQTGLPADSANALGPLIDERQRRIVNDHVRDAVARGARLLTGGVTPAGPGYFYPPTVLADVTADMDVITTETFGPLAPVMVVDSFERALTEADRSEYGLAVTVLTHDDSRARAARALDVGTVWINEWHGYQDGALHSAGRNSGLGAIGWRGESFLDAVTAPQFWHRA